MPDHVCNGREVVQPLGGGYQRSVWAGSEGVGMASVEGLSSGSQGRALLLRQANNPHPLLIKGFVLVFLKYGSWEALDWCEILLRGVGTICPPGEQYSENFRKSPKSREVYTMFQNSQNCRQITATPSRSIFHAAKSLQMPYKAKNQKNKYVHNKIKNSLELRLAKQYSRSNKTGNPRVNK